MYQMTSSFTLQSHITHFFLRNEFRLKNLSPKVSSQFTILNEQNNMNFDINRRDLISGVTNTISYCTYKHKNTNGRLQKESTVLNLYMAFKKVTVLQ